MNNKFTVINSKQDNQNSEIAHVERLIKTYDGWQRQFVSHLEKMENRKISDLPQSELSKIGLAGIKLIAASRNINKENKRLLIDCTKTLEETQVEFTLLSGIFNIISFFTPRNLITTFPVDKVYDGDKWDCKDYFFTMKILSKLDWDKPIGKDKLMDLLWDYQNKDLRNAYMDYISDLSAIYKSQTGKGIAEEWSGNMGIPTYTADKKTEIIKNNSTGEISKLKNTDHFTVIK